SMDFEWLPKDLTTRCDLLIHAHHRGDGYSSLPTILWHKETQVFIAVHEDLREMVGTASKAWRSKKRNEYYVLVAAIILALEMLATDFAGWGTAFPEARRKAGDLLREYLPNDRTRLLDIYLPHRAELDPALMKQFGPTP